MHQKILEIIKFLISEIDDIPNPELSDFSLLSEKLLDRGYTDSDIRNAIEYIMDSLFYEDRGNLGVDEPGSRAIPLRVLSRYEKEFFSADAYGFLIQLQILGIVSIFQLELIIDRCLMLGLDPVSLDDVKTISSQILLGQEIDTDNTDAIFYPGNDTVH
ncbi:MAG TPA: DUF494 family protein [Caldithrix sp.]|nr:DUF494 family protein [Caldithrix sp.]